MITVLRRAGRLPVHPAESLSGPPAAGRQMVPEIAAHARPVRAAGPETGLLSRILAPQGREGRALAKARGQAKHNGQVHREDPVLHPVPEGRDVRGGRDVPDPERRLRGRCPKARGR
jgi:hypothetical protein